MNNTPYHTAIILLGSNLGDKHRLLNEAMNSLSSIGEVLRYSSIYESPAWGFKAETTFYNAVVVLSTPIDCFTLMNRCHSFEKELGRERATTSTNTENKDSSYSSRNIDIDILDFDNKIVNTDNLILPHPRLHLRRFTLIPLTEVAPLWRHPKLSLTASELLDKCPDNGEVTILTDSSLYIKK